MDATESLGARGSGHDVERCADGEALIESAIAHHPALVVYRMRPDAAADLAVLQLLRRVARDAPLILLASEGSVATRLSVHGLRPTYFAVAPVDEHELEEAVSSALRRPRPRQLDEPGPGGPGPAGWSGEARGDRTRLRRHDPRLGGSPHRRPRGGRGAARARRRGAARDRPPAARARTRSRRPAPVRRGGGRERRSRVVPHGEPHPAAGCRTSA